MDLDINWISSLTDLETLNHIFEKLLITKHSTNDSHLRRVIQSKISMVENYINTHSWDL
jgi:hypothetical protein